MSETMWHLVSSGKVMYKNINLISCLSDSDMPDHDLEPPRFAQLALERVLQDWNALKSMIMFGSEENKDPWVWQQNCKSTNYISCGNKM